MLLNNLEHLHENLNSSYNLSMQIHSMELMTKSILNKKTKQKSLIKEITEIVVEDVNDEIEILPIGIPSNNKILHLFNISFSCIYLKLLCQYLLFLVD